MWRPWLHEPNNQPRNQPTMIQFLQRLFGRGAPLTPGPSPARGEGSGRKGAPSSLVGGQWSGSNYVDAWKRSRSPSPNELMAELKGVAWACASINAAVCASNPPALYVASTSGDQSAKCPTKAITRRTESRLRAQQHLQPFTKSARQIEEVTSHPLLALLAQANPVHSAFDLWELTTLYLGPAGHPDRKAAGPGRHRRSALDRSDAVRRGRSHADRDRGQRARQLPQEPDDLARGGARGRPAVAGQGHHAAGCDDAGERVCGAEVTGLPSPRLRGEGPGVRGRRSIR